MYIRDSRDNPSATLTIIILTWIATTFALFTHIISPSDYTMIIGVILTGWLGREYTEKRSKN